MPRVKFRHALMAVLLLVAMLAQGTWALAGTSGGISGTLTDGTTGKPVGNAKINVLSQSESESSTTDASGRFTFLNLTPDTYTVSATKDGFVPVSVTGVTVFADQSQSVALQTRPELKTIAKVTSRAAGNLVKPGTTSDVYSVNAATQEVVAGSGGGFNLNSAYSAVYAQPGVTSSLGNYGWGQVFYIRGSAYSQIGYEFDGVPVNRAFDNYQANSLASLGQQELQVYTGGSPSGSSSATLGGFINQVIKTGTYPGFGGLKGGIGAPGFYHALTAEAGGSNPSRTFSYYVGLMGFNQHFPYGNFQNQSNINPAGFSKYGLVADNEFATLNAALTCGINAGCPDGGNYANQFSNGPFAPCNNTTGVPNGYSAANPGPFNGACRGYGPFGNGYLSDEYERDNVINLHFAVPHKHDGGRDDIQLLFDNSMQYQINASSINDNGGLAYINGQLAPFATADCGGGTPCGSFTGSGAPYTGPYAGLCGYENLENVGCAQINSPLPYIDSHIFAPGTQFGQPAATAKVIPYYFPNSPTNRPLNTPLAPVSGLPTSLRDGSWNDVNIVKAQYTKNFGSNAFARLLGYTFYSDWMISGPTCAATGYFDGFLNGGLCGNTADYELPTHTRGAELLVADQINAKNLLQFNANYTTASVTRFNNSSWEAGIAGSRTGVTNLTNGDPNNPICYSYVTGAQASCFSSSTYGTYTDPERAGACAARISAGKTPCAAIPAGAQWLVTVPGGQGTYNTVKPIFTSASLQDEFKPTDRLDLNFGVRFENYTYDLANTNTPEFNFWFNEGAQVNCYDPATGLPMITPLGPGQPVPPSPVQTAPGASCGFAPSGQPGVHPTGGKGPNSGSLLYSAASPSSYSHTLFSPRVSGTYALSPDSVLRFSAGRYTQPTETAFEQYGDQSGKRAAAFNFSQFWGLGFFTPGHDNPVQTSNNFDFSFEHHFHNTDVTMKLSPFYRYTQHEIVSLVLGPGFVSGVNVGTQKSAGVELAIQKGDPSRDGWAGQLSYTYTNAKIKYGNLPNGTNGIDYLNNYVKAFNGLTKAGGGAPCYTPTFDTSGNFTGGAADASCANTADVKNPYYNMNQQGLLDRNGWYDTYPNEPPNDPTDQGGTSAIAPHTFAGYVQYKRGRFSIAPNFELIAGSYYGSPTDTYGVDPRACSQNQAAATDALGNNILPAGSQYAQNPDFLSCGGSSFVQSGYLAIPNPYTGSMDSVGQFQEPWQFNLGALIKYQVSNKVTLNLTLANIVNTCFGGTKTAWQKAFAPNNYVCGYSSNPLGTGNQTYIGPQSGQPGFGGGFFYGANGNDPVNGGQAYSPTYNYPFAPFSGALPFQAYVELQVKL